MATIKTVNNEKGPGREKAFASALQKRAEWFLAQHKDCPVDYTAKYRELAEQEDAERAAAEERAAAAARAEAAVRAASAQPAATRQNADGGQSMVCPRCGAPMVVRTARRGDRAGKQFYGCSNYPKCRAIFNID